MPDEFDFFGPALPPQQLMSLLGCVVWWEKKNFLITGANTTCVSNEPPFTLLTLMPEEIKTLPANGEDRVEVYSPAILPDGFRRG